MRVRRFVLRANWLENEEAKTLTNLDVNDFDEKKRILAGLAVLTGPFKEGEAYVEAKEQAKLAATGARPSSEKKGKQFMGKKL